MSAAVPEPAAVSARRRRTREQLLAVLARHDALSRAELARLTGLSRSAVGACVSDLVEQGLVGEGPATAAPAGPGRPAAVVRLRRGAGIVLGLDFGHTHVTAAVADTEGRILAERGEILDVDGRPQQALDAGARLAHAALAACGATMDEVVGAAAGIPGPIDVRTSVVREPTILASWIGLDPEAELGARLRRPVTVANDADMGARAEHLYGAGRGIDDLVYVKASHGIGAGLILGGRPYRGATGIAGEIGHTQLPGAINWCRCGNQGCLETVVSVGAVRRRLEHVLGGAAPDRLPPMAELAASPAAARVLTDAGRTVGRVLADLVNCLNPAAVILGGELGAAGEPLVAGVRESIDRHAGQGGAGAVRVLGGRLGERAELLGAVAAAIQSSSAAGPAVTAVTRPAAPAAVSR
ncbi:ROK family transcriptional regulator [Actinospica durhamensis]|uniref:ROK family transcriptional regulator n=1 Tax=Actinospica durhamensis TaxID=1508375 RepID=A0A941ELS7_9ACTN|nr:ROK family transcriptional regulator [Actinospica durhamensis]MBR7832698.1 ROK family transcriptional regulator [Actinospica durhamensis]